MGTHELKIRARDSLEGKTHVPHFNNYSLTKVHSAEINNYRCYEPSEKYNFFSRSRTMRATPTRSTTYSSSPTTAPPSCTYSRTAASSSSTSSSRPWAATTAAYGAETTAAAAWTRGTPSSGERKTRRRRPGDSSPEP